MGISFRDDLRTVDDLKPSSKRVMARQRLRALADQVAGGGVVSVIAGPGYGKTSFLTDMLSTFSGHRAFWAFEENDQPPVRFLAGLAQSLGLDSLGFSAFDACNRSPHDESKQASLVLLRTIRSFMEKRSGEGGLVAIDNLCPGAVGPGLSEALSLVAATLPPRWRLLLASQQPVSFDRLRLGGRLVEIHGAQLRFTPTEIRAWFAETWDASLDLGEAKSVWRATQGWPAAIALLGTSLLSRLGLRSGPAPSVDDAGAFSTYLLRSVQGALDPRQSEIIIAAALLPRVLFPRDEHYLPGEPGEAESVLGGLASRSFLVCRTGHRAFAVHPLVAEYVKQQSSGPGQSSNKVQRAAAHLETTGDFRAAVSLLLHSRKLEDASRLIRQMAIESYEPGLPDAPSEWLAGLRAVTHGNTDAYPWLTVAEAAIHQNHGDFRRSNELYQRASESILADGDRQGGLSVLLGRALCLAGLSRHEEVPAIVQQCRPLVDSTRQRVGLLATEAAHLTQFCQCGSAMARYDEAVALAPLDSSWSPTTRLRAGANKSVIFHRLGCYERGRTEIEKTLALADSRTSFLFTLVLNNAATMNAHTGGYAQARRQLNEAERLMRSHCYAFIRSPVLLNRIMMFEAEGDIREALRVAKVARAAASEEGHQGDEYWALQLHGDLWRRAKNPARALECHRAALALVEDGVMGQFGRSLAKTHVAMDLVLLGRETEAEEMLRDCVRFGRSGEFYGILMPALFYLGWIHARAGRRTEAVQCLTRSLKIAEEHRHIHFVCQEARVATPILVLCEQLGIGSFIRDEIVPRLSPKVQSDFLRAMKSAPVPNEAISPTSRGARTAQSAAVASLPVVRPLGEQIRSRLAGRPTDRRWLTSGLTERELQVLGLIAEGLTNRAVAGRLSITEGTVKLHTNSLFRKLGVTNRLQATLIFQRERPEGVGNQAKESVWSQSTP